MNNVSARTLRHWLCISLASFFLAGCSWFTWLPWVDEEVDLSEPAELVKFKAEVDLDREWKSGISSNDPPANNSPTSSEPVDSSSKP